MKTIFYLCFFVLLTSCGVTTGYMGHNVTTNVNLEKNNFKVVKTVSGSADGHSFIGIALNQKNLFERAKREMINNAELIGGSKAIINVTTDVNAKWFLIWGRKTITLSGEVIEFY